MKESLKNSISIVAGQVQSLAIAIIRQLLESDALVIVPASNADTILQIKAKVADVRSGTLVTLIADPMDYERSREITEHIQHSYGKIDLVIVLSCATYSPLPLTELDYTTWDTMQCESLSYLFMTARLVLPFMKHNRQGTFIQVCADPLQKTSAPSPLGKIASVLHIEMSKQLDREVKAYGVYYYHVFAQTGNDEMANSKDAFYILGLYQDREKKSLFHPAPKRVFTREPSSIL